MWFLFVSKSMMNTLVDLIKLLSDYIMIEVANIAK